MVPLSTQGRSNILHTSHITQVPQSLPPSPLARPSQLLIPCHLCPTLAMTLVIHPWAVLLLLVVTPIMAVVVTPTMAAGAAVTPTMAAGAVATPTMAVGAAATTAARWCRMCLGQVASAWCVSRCLSMRPRLSYCFLWCLCVSGLAHAWGIVPLVQAHVWSHVSGAWICMWTVGNADVRRTYRAMTQIPYMLHMQAAYNPQPPPMGMYGMMPPPPPPPAFGKCSTYNNVFQRASTCR